MTLKAALEIKRVIENSKRQLSPFGQNLYRRAIQTIRQHRKPVSNPRMSLQQAVQNRLSQFLDVHESGVTEMTGRLRRDYTDPTGWDQGEVIGRFGGMKSGFPEMEKIPDSPKAIAAAIRRGKGKVYRRVVHVVREQMEREGFRQAVKRSPGRSVVPAHEGKSYCNSCKVAHSKNQHRFHGSGSFHRTHLWGFPKVNPGGKPVVIYSRVMAITARKGQPHPAVCDAECKKKNHCYIHEFRPGAVMYGLPNGDILIRSDRK